MTRTITRLFDSHKEAKAAVETLESEGVEHEKISLVSHNADNSHAAHAHAEPSMNDANPDRDADIAGGAGKGATTGGLIGGGAGLLAGLGMLAIPGLGPVVAAGWLVSTAVGAVVGAAAGGATGGLLGALKDAGHTDEEANVYSEGVRRGGSLVSVKADDADATRIEQLLNSNSGVDAIARGQAYRAEGWTAFDEHAEPYSGEQVTIERQRHKDSGSFAGGDGGEAAGDGTAPQAGIADITPPIARP